MATNIELIKHEYGHLTGRVIKQVRPLTGSERELFGWGKNDNGVVAFALILDNGMALIPSRDDEGNAAGVLFVEKLGSVI